MRDMTPRTAIPWRLLSLALSVFVASTSTASAGSFVALDDGTPLRWADGADLGVDGPYIPILVNASNASGLSSWEVEQAVVDAMLAWREASGNGFSFDVWVGTDPELFPAALTYDGAITLYFASNDENGLFLGGGSAGFTQLWFDENGTILEADVVLNDAQFGFTTDPSTTDYTADGVFGKTLLLSDLVTHELGHLLGLGHNGVFGSTMFPSAWAQASTLACDDTTTIRHHYAPSDTGLLEGQVVVQGVGGLAGIEVLVVSATKREPFAATLTEADGSFSFSGLPRDTYHLIAQTYRGDIDGLPIPLAESWENPCVDGHLARTPLQVDGQMVPLEVDGGDTPLIVESLVLRCDGGIDAPEPLDGDNQVFARDLPVVDGNIATLHRIEHADDGVWYRLEDIEGSLSLDILTYSLFSHRSAFIELLDVDGSPVEASITVPVLDMSDVEYQVWDTRIQATDLPPGDYFLNIEMLSISTHLYPGGETFLDEAPFALFLGTVGTQDPFASGQPPGCHPEVLESYVSPGGNPVRRTIESEPAPEENGCGCQAGYTATGSAFGALAIGINLLIRRRESS